ncbi:hypothetical protein DBR06_SOUSAS2610053, partial [Sousa chinensis]
GPHRSVFCLTFLNTQYQLGSQLGVSRHFPNGQRAPRFCHLLEAIGRGLSLCKLYSWKLGCGLEISSMLQSRDKAWVSSMVVTTGDAWAYVADQDGSVPVYDIEEYGLQGPEPQPPRSGLELIEEEKFLLSSSLDHTVHLWSTDGEYIGKHR